MPHRPGWPGWPGCSARRTACPRVRAPSHEASGHSGCGQRERQTRCGRMAEWLPGPGGLADPEPGPLPFSWLHAYAVMGTSVDHPITGFASSWQEPAVQCPGGLSHLWLRVFVHTPPAAHKAALQPEPVEFAPVQAAHERKQAQRNDLDDPGRSRVFRLVTDHPLATRDRAVNETLAT